MHMDKTLTLPNLISQIVISRLVQMPMSHWNLKSQWLMLYHFTVCIDRLQT